VKFRPELRLVEYVAGVWSYHLAAPDTSRSLCGVPVMNTLVPLATWGRRPEPRGVPYRWCATCTELGAKST
jgi:hypothetical protein